MLPILDHIVWERLLLTITLNSCGFILSKCYLETFLWMQTGNQADLCMPVGMHMHTNHMLYFIFL